MSNKVLAILAGGYGKRATPLTKGEHKSLLELPGWTTIITRLITQAVNNGIKKMYLVHFTPAPPHLIEVVTEIANSLGVRLTLIGQDPSKYYGTMFALKLVCQKVNEGEEVIVFEGDVVVSDKCAITMFSAKETAFFIDDIEKYDDESMKAVIKKSDSISFFSKQVHGYPEFCGVMILDSTLRKAYVKKSSVIVSSNPFYEEVFNQLVSDGIKFPYIIVPESDWIEIDTEEDYKEAVKRVKRWNSL